MFGTFFHLELGMQLRQLVIEKAYFITNIRSHFCLAKIMYSFDQAQKDISIFNIEKVN